MAGCSGVILKYGVNGWVLWCDIKHEINLARNCVHWEARQTCEILNSVRQIFKSFFRLLRLQEDFIERCLCVLVPLAVPEICSSCFFITVKHSGYRDVVLYFKVNIFQRC